QPRPRKSDFLHRPRQARSPPVDRTVRAALACMMLALGTACADNEGLSALPLGLAVVPSQLTFAATPLGLSRTATVALLNTGGAPLNVLSLRIAGGAAFSIADGAPDALGAGQRI